jgi:peptide/nickel transport system substrate-binding protein
MGERSVFRDVVFSVLLIIVVIELYVILRQNEHDVAQRMDEISKKQDDQESVLRDMLTELKKTGRTVVVEHNGIPNTAASTGTETAVETNSGKFKFVAANVIPSVEEAEKQYIDPKAEPGGTLYRVFLSDPGTLNPLTENDATVTDIHEYVSENLASRDYKNLDLYKPELATHWEQSQLSSGVPVKSNAKELVEKLNAGLSAEAKAWIKASVDANGRVELAISKLGDGYLKEISKVVPLDSFVQIQWVITKFSPDAGEKDFPDAQKVMDRFKDLLAGKPELKLLGDQVWAGESGFVFRLPGSKDAAEALIKTFLAEKEQLGPKGQVWLLDKTETYSLEDKLFYTFHLRPNVKWHDGTPLTANDYLFSFKTLKDPGVDCQPSRNYFIDCENLEAPDDHTLRFTWRKLFSSAFEQSASLTLLPEHIFKYTSANDFNTSVHNKEAYGTGPYKFKEWLPQQRIVLERNENYWGTKPNFKEVYFRIVKESAVRFQMLKNKKIDFEGLTPPQWINDVPKPPFGEEHGLSAFKQYDLYYNYLGWNARLPRLADKRVRKALTLSINRDKILHELLYNLGMVVSGTFYSNGPYNNPDIKPWPYDPEAGKKLFAEAGWSDHDGDGFLDKDGERFKIRILFPAASETAKKVLVAVQSDLKKVGVDCELDPIEWAVFLNRIKKREFDSFFLGWQLGWDPDPYQLWHSSQAAGEGSNHCYFVNAEADEIIEKLRRTFDFEERKKLCWRFQQIQQDEQPYTFMFNSMSLGGHNADLRNVYLPLKPGEERIQYIPFGSKEHGFTRYWYMPRALQRMQD